jgi:hypothetical protein
MEQIGFHWNYFHEMWCLNIFRNPVEKIQVSLNRAEQVSRPNPWRKMMMMIKIGQIKGTFL